MPATGDPRLDHLLDTCRQLFMRSDVPSCITGHSGRAMPQELKTATSTLSCLIIVLSFRASPSASRQRGCWQ
jgi:hypothetical protein